MVTMRYLSFMEKMTDFYTSGVLDYEVFIAMVKYDIEVFFVVHGLVKGFRCLYFSSADTMFKLTGTFVPRRTGSTMPVARSLCTEWSGRTEERGQGLKGKSTNGMIDVPISSYGGVGRPRLAKWE